MSKHSPGPWRAIESESSGTDRRHLQIAIRSESGHMFSLGSTTGDDRHQQRMADARLIAAAPDLLEALRRCLADDAGDLEPETVHIAMQAIAKAEGR